MQVFDRPQAALLPDPAGPRMYANVSNVMEVATGTANFAVCVAVPTLLFSFMKDVARIPPEVEVTLAIDAVADGFVFSMLAGDHLYDLWRYSKGSLPEWLLGDRTLRIPL